MIYQMNNDLIKKIKKSVDRTDLVMKYNSLSELYLNEVKEHYKWSVKKSIVDYVLRNENEQKRLNVSLKKNVTQIQIVILNSKTAETRLVLSEQLFSFDPIPYKIYCDFNRKYSDYKFIDIASLASLMPITIIEFKQKSIEQLNENKKYLIQNWIKDCVDLISNGRESIESLFANNNEVKRMDLLDKYFETISAIISLHLRRIVTNTLDGLKKFFSNYKNGNKYEDIFDFTNSNMVIPFISCLISDQTTDSTALNPNIENTDYIINEIIDCIITSLTEFPRLEILLFENVEVLNLKYRNLVQNNEDLVVECKQFIKQIIDLNLEGPKE